MLFELKPSSFILRYKCHVCENFECRNDTTEHDNICHDGTYLF